MIPPTPTTSHASILLRVLAPTLLLVIAIAALLLAGNEPVLAQDGDAQADTSEGGTPREGYEERLAARIKRYQDALAAEAASEQGVAGATSGRPGSGAIEGLVSPIEEGKSSTFRVTAKGLDPDYYYEHIFQIGAREEDAKTPAHGDIGFDRECRSIIMSILVPRRDASEDKESTLWGCKAGNYKLTMVLREFNHNDDPVEVYELSNEEYDVKVIDEPGAVDNLRVTGRTKQLNVTWKAPEDDGNSPITHYEVRHQEKSSSSWSSWKKVTALTTTVSGLKDSTTYTVEVRAVNAVGPGPETTKDETTSRPTPTPTPTPSPTPTPTSTPPPTPTPTPTPKPNNPPRITQGPASVSHRENGLAVATYTATDPDGDPIRWSVSGTDGGDFSIGSTGRLSFAVSPDYESPRDSDEDNVYKVTVRASDGKLSVTRSVTVTVTNVNERPSVSGRSSVSYAENGAGAVATYAADDPEGDAVTWSVSGADAGRFGISSAGNLSFASPPDYETPRDSDKDNVYLVTVEASDSSLTGTLAVSVRVTDVEESSPLVVSGPASPSYAENGTGAVGIYASTNPDNGTITWSLAGADAGKFSIGGMGELSFASSPDYESPGDAGEDNGYDVTVRSSAGGSRGALAVTVTVTDVNETPVVSGPASASYAENGTGAVGIYTSTNPDGGTITWSVSGADAGKFSIGGTGELAFASSPDYENPGDDGTDNGYDVTVQADDGGGAGGLAVVVTVTDEDEPPSAPAAPRIEAAAVGGHRALAVTWVAPPNAGPAISDYDVQYRVKGSADFTDTGFTGAGTSATVTGLEPATTYEVQVRAANAEGTGGWSAPGEGTTDSAANKAPVFKEGSSTTRTVDENAANFSPVGQPVLATDEDSRIIVYTFQPEDPARRLFGIDNATGQIEVIGGPIDYEGRSSYSAIVHARDLHGGRAAIAVTIKVNDVDEPPGTPDAPVVERAETGGHMALKVSWEAPANTGPAITDYDVQHRACDGDGESCGDVADAGFTGAGTSATVIGLDPEMVYEVQVRATNDEGTGAWSAFGKGATGIAPNKAPAFSDGESAARSVNENTRAGEPVGAPIAATDEPGDVLTYSLASADGTSDADVFSIVTSSGQIETKKELDHEAKAGYSVVVTVRDGKGGEASIPVTITVADVNEPPAAPGAPTVTAAATGGHATLTVTWTAPSTTGPAITDYDVQYRACDSGGENCSGFTDAGFTGTGTSATITGLKPETTYAVQVRAWNDEGAGGWSASGEGTTGEAPNAVPSFEEGAAASRSVPENTPAGGAVGTPVAAADDDALTYFLSGDDAGAFAINDSTGQIKVGAGVSLDYEDPADTDKDNAYDVVVSVTDGKDADGGADGAVDATIAVTITVTDQKKPTALKAPAVRPAATGGHVKLDVTWKPPTGEGAMVTGYDVRYRVRGSRGYTDAPHDGGATRATVTGLSPSTAYEVQIRAVNAEGAGPWSKAGRGSTGAAVAPLQPTDFTAAAGNAQVVLAWADPEDPTITKWQYRVRKGNGQWRWVDVPESTASTTTHRVTGLTNGSKYSFRLRAVNAKGAGTATSIQTVRPRAGSPAKPTGLQVTPGDGRLTLSWDDPGDASIVGYQLNRRTGRTWGAWGDIPMSAPGEANATSHTVTGLSNDTAYTFAVRAVNAHGPSPASDPVTGAPVAVPPRPTGLTATEGNARVTLRWKDPSNPTITRYEYTRDGGVTWVAIPDSAHGGANAASFAVTGLTNAKTYTFALRAVNGSGTSAASDTVEATPTYPPGRPTRLRTEKGNGWITLRWDDPRDGTITGYQYRRKEAGGRFGAWTDISGSGASTTSFTVTGLTNGTKYTFALRAVNVSGRSRAATVSATPGGAVSGAQDGVQGASSEETAEGMPLAQPIGLTATLDGGRVMLAWRPSTDPRIVAYQYNAACGEGWGAWADVPGSAASTASHVIEGFTGGASCSFTVRSLSADDNSPPADAARLTPAGGRR